MVELRLLSQAFLLARKEAEQEGESSVGESGAAATLPRQDAVGSGLKQKAEVFTFGFMPCWSETVRLKLADVFIL